MTKVWVAGFRSRKAVFSESMARGVLVAGQSGDSGVDERLGSFPCPLSRQASGLLRSIGRTLGWLGMRGLGRLPFAL